MTLVSHKTRRPYKGPPYDSQSSMELARKISFFRKILDGEKPGVLEETKADKIARINSLNCTHYIDDLPEILNMWLIYTSICTTHHLLDMNRLILFN